MCNIALSQQSEQAFLSTYAETGAQEFFYKSSRAGSGGYIYVAGASINNEGHYDMLLTKYSGSTEVWSVTWDGSDGDDYASGIVIDSGGNIILCGASEVTSTNYNAVVVKYNSSGTLQWSSSYAGSAGLADGFVSVVLDNSDNIYTCGGTQTTSELVNYLTVKYNSSGTQQWASTYDYADLYDLAVKLVVSGTTVRTSGGTQINTDDWQMTTVSYNTSTGAQGSVQHTGGDDDGMDKVTDVYTDGTYTYVVGSVRNTSTGFDWKVIKLNSDLVVQWSTTYNGTANEDDQAECVKVDASGNVYVTGWASITDEGRNYVTRKYNSSGTVQWTSTFNEDSEENDDEALTLEIDGSGNLIVSGSSYKDGNKDYFTIKYKYTDGSEVWRTRFNSDYNDEDIPSNIALDENGNVFVIGTIGKGNGFTTYMMCKYVVKTVYSPVPTDGFSSSGGYFTNKGQLRNEDGTANTGVKFYCQKNSPSTYIENSKISYVYSSPKADTLEADTLHRVDMKFNKGVTNAIVYPLFERPEYANFYLGHMPMKRERIGIYNSVVKLDTYTNTDIIFDNNSSGYRHWIVARSGAPTGDFEMEYTGQNSLSVDGNGNLVIGTSVGAQIQPKARAYTMNNTTGELTLLAWQPDYNIVGNIVTFTNIGSWDGTLVLELKQVVGGGGESIDNIELEWSTYFGGQEEDFLYDVVGEFTGRSWTVGSAESSDFIQIPGSVILNEISAESDVLITTFQPDCSVIWFTYYGGSLDDVGTAITLTDAGFPVVVGHTVSDDLPDAADGPLDDSTLGGTKDGFILRLSPNGAIILDSYIGGDGDDVVADVGFNMFGGIKDIYLVGSTDSDESSFPLISPSGAYNQPFAGVDAMDLNGDGFIMRINEVNNQPIWRTFFGSDKGERILRLTYALNDLFIMGNTTSMEYSTDECAVPTDGLFPHCITGGSWENTDFENNNGYNYFIARFDKTSNALDWSTIVCPSPQSAFVGNDYSNGLSSQSPAASSIYMTGFLPQADDENFPFVTSLGTNSYNQQETFNSGAFLIRFRVEEGFNNVIWATAVDGYGDQQGATVSVSNDGTVYIAGDGDLQVPQAEADWCTLPDYNEFPICNSSGNSYLEANVSAPPYRSFICAFNSDDQIIWSTFFGNYFHNNAYSSSCAGDYVFICGDATYPTSAENPSWTLQEWDFESITDYYQDAHGGETDGTITRFHRTLMVGIKEEELIVTSDMLLYPIPTHGIMNVVLPAAFRSGCTINVLDNLGRIVFSQPLLGRIAFIDVGVLANGSYVVQLNNGTIMMTKSFVKQ